MIRRFSTCAICENSNPASICAGCVNYGLNERHTLLTPLKSRRDSLHLRLSELLVAKGKSNGQQSWQMLQNEKLASLKEKLRHEKEQLQQRKAKLERLSHDLKGRYSVLESAHSTLEKIRVSQLERYYPNLIGNCYLVHMENTSERLYKQSLVMKQICKLFPLCNVTTDRDMKDGCNGQYDLICNARLPRGLNPQSVPSKELAASLGYMVRLLNLVVQNLAVPALHNSGFAGSCSRIWQRDSYWNARPSSRSNEYPLFIPSLNYCSTSVETSWVNRSSSDFGMELVGSSELDFYGGDDFNNSSASPRSAEACRELQKGIALLKKSVACITAYCYNSLYLEVPSESSTFEAFAKLLATLSSSKEVRSAFSLASSRSSSRQEEQVNKSVLNLDSATSSTLLDSTHTLPTLGTIRYNSLLNSTPSYLYATEVSNVVKNESLIDGWDFVEHPTSPHQAMFMNAKKN